MEYDIIFVTGELYFDHPLCGVAILKRLLEREGYTVGVIEQPQNEKAIQSLGKPKLFFGITSGGIDSMVRNYTPLKKLRADDEYLDYNESVQDRAVTVYSNWVKKHFKDSKLIIGGTEASLRRFVHYDYWQNRLRKPILFDTRADIISYGMSEKQIVEIARRISAGKDLSEIPGTCVVLKEMPSGIIVLPSYDDVVESKEKFCDMQNMLTNKKDLVQKVDTRYVVQYKFPEYTSADLDDYYGLPFTREVPKELRGFEFSVVTHRGCIGNCNFCSLRLIQGERVISRSEDSIIAEIEQITKLPTFKGNIDDLGGPSVNMYGMDCNKCSKDCLGCKVLDRSNKRLIALMRRARSVPGVKNVFIKSGIRFDLASPEYIKEISKYHIFDTLRIAPEHVNKKMLQLMHKDYGDYKKFVQDFKKTGKHLSFYFIAAHPGSTMDDAIELGRVVKKLENSDSVQIFTPTPMTVSTCMYYTSMDPKTKKKIYVPYSYSEKKQQKRAVFD